VCCIVQTDCIFYIIGINFLDLLLEIYSLIGYFAPLPIDFSIYC
jgi:hypothetical protein